MSSVAPAVGRAAEISNAGIDLSTTTATDLGSARIKPDASFDLSKLGPSADASIDFSGHLPESPVQVQGSLLSALRAAGLGAQQAQVEAILSAASIEDRAATSRNIETLLRRTDISAQQISAAIAAVHDIAAAPRLTNGLENRKSELITALSSEMANPESISIGKNFTCSVGLGVEFRLCKTAPELYAKLWSGLAIEGRGQWASGESLVLNKDAIAADAAGNRSLTMRVFQASAMSFATGGNYDALTDTCYTMDGPHRGLYRPEYQSVLNAAFNQATGRIDTPLFIGDAAASDPRELMRLMQSAGGNIVCEVQLAGRPPEESRHVITFLGIETRNGQEIVKVFDSANPQSTNGIVEFSREEFEGMLCTALIPAEALPENDPRRSRGVMELDAEPKITYAVSSDGCKIIHAEPKLDAGPLISSAGNINYAEREQEEKRKKEGSSEPQQPAADGAVTGRERIRSVKGERDDEL